MYQISHAPAYLHLHSKTPEQTTYAFWVTMIQTSAGLKIGIGTQNDRST